ncbi:MAG: hypothetical protein Q8L35_02805 [Actinomycetota bacterium]|nr:hypothetical protein [Actinomycetota bacterium]
MKLTVSVIEFIVELFMGGMFLYAVYIFWQRYRRNSNPILLVLTIAFVLMFVGHTIAAVIMEDLLGYKFSGPLEPHHLFLFITLGFLIYLARKTQWRVKLPRPPNEEEKKAS